MFRLICVKLGIVLMNFIARVWFTVAMTSDRLYFPSVEIEKIYSLSLARWKSLCQGWSRNQPKLESFSQQQGGRGERPWERGYQNTTFTSLLT